MLLRERESERAIVNLCFATVRTCMVGPLIDVAKIFIFFDGWCTKENEKFL